MNLLLHYWQIVLYGIPDHTQVNLEIGVRNAIAHRIDRHPRYFGVLVGEIGIGLFDVVRGLTKDFDIADDAVLDQ